MDGSLAIKYVSIAPVFPTKNPIVSYITKKIKNNTESLVTFNDLFTYSYRDCSSKIAKTKMTL